MCYINIINKNKGGNNNCLQNYIAFYFEDIELLGIQVKLTISCQFDNIFIDTTNGNYNNYIFSV